MKLLSERARATLLAKRLGSSLTAQMPGCAHGDAFRRVPKVPIRGRSPVPGTHSPIVIHGFGADTALPFGEFAAGGNFRDGARF